MRIGAILSAMLPPGPVGLRGSRRAEADRADESTAAGAAEGDSLDLSPEARAAADAQAAESGEEEPAALPTQLTLDERRQVLELAAVDREVRAHEQAHLSVAGPYAKGGARFEYQEGPDGRRYAVGGEVALDTSPEADPEDTIRKAQVIRAAALAPAEPSAQDRRVAAAAANMESTARAELARQQKSDGLSTSEEERTEDAAESVSPEVGMVLGDPPFDDPSEIHSLAEQLGRIPFRGDSGGVVAEFVAHSPTTFQVVGRHVDLIA
ncbi:MAG: hypothetical protein JW809_19865 [Pirellulales bacterium]|nr:hypothetical protein [Pirellulales bacterium]